MQTNLMESVSMRDVPLMAETIPAQFIKPDFLEMDLELFTSKWFDYRHMTPMEATMVYIDAYLVVYREMYKRELDRKTAENLNLGDADRFIAKLTRGERKDKARFAGFWRGRQVADAIGMPYPDFIELMMTYRMRAWKQRFLPHPQHLYHEIDVEKTLARWEELQETRIYTSDHPAYLNQNYRNTRAQNDYHEWLFLQVGKRMNPAYYYARLIEQDQIPVEKVEARADPETYEKVLSYLE